MSPSPAEQAASLGLAPRFLLVLAATALASEFLARLAPRLGWGARHAREVRRKPEGRAVPTVGGAALLVGLACAGRPLSEWLPLWERFSASRLWPLAALLLLFAVGTWDDLRAPRAGRKALAQLAALSPLALGPLLEGARSEGLEGCLVVALGFLAINLLNTFDNADGALALLCALGFARSTPLASAACLGFLPSNLDSARARNAPSGAPSAYLGDAGAHVLGFLALMQPSCWGLFALPALDLLRLSWVRLAAGSWPWIGDRRHLAHRLAARGCSRPGTALLLAAVALPACGLWPLASERGELVLALAGLGSSAALFAQAVRASRDP
jgi:UDP-GlcNAc:undecaprenyl-phosphate GlcNAc-1-phosphate transferase